MTKLEFTQAIANKGEGVIPNTAKIAIETSQIDLYIEEWLEQCSREVSCKHVKNLLGDELFNALQTFK
jgi:hypothetical protein